MVFVGAASLHPPWTHWSIPLWFCAVCHSFVHILISDHFMCSVVPFIVSIETQLLVFRSFLIELISSNMFALDGVREGGRTTRQIDFVSISISNHQRKYIVRASPNDCRQTKVHCTLRVRTCAKIGLKSKHKTHHKSEIVQNEMQYLKLRSGKWLEWSRLDACNSSRCWNNENRKIKRTNRFQDVMLRFIVHLMFFHWSLAS